GNGSKGLHRGPYPLCDDDLVSVATAINRTLFESTRQKGSNGFAQSRLGHRAHMGARYFLEPRVRQGLDQRLRRTVVPISVSADPERRPGHGGETFRRRIVARTEQEPRRYTVDLHRLHELHGHVGRIALAYFVEAIDRVDEESRAALPAGEAFQSHARQDESSRSEAGHDRPRRGARAQREADQIEIIGAQRIDDGPDIADQNVWWIGRGLVRLGAGS